MTHESKHKAKGAWNGYTMAELEYKRALTLARMEIQKERLAEDYDRVRMGNFNLAPSTFTKAMGVMNYLDYAVLAIKTVRRISSIFRRKK